MKTLHLLVAGSLLWSTQTLAQSDADAGQAPGVVPQAVNPGDGQPAAVIRDMGDTEPALQPMQVDVQPLPVKDAALPNEESLKRKADNADDPWEFEGTVSGSARISYQGNTLFPIDADGTTARVAPLLTRIRVTPEIHMKGFGVVLEADAATGAILGTPSSALVGERVTYPAFTPVELRKAYLEYKWQSGAFRIGQQTSNWGLGLLANDGNADPQAGDFGQQQYGNLTYRALLAVRPLFNLGGRAKAFETAFAADLIVRDNFGEFSRGDRAWQGVVAVRFNKDENNNFGVYAVYRNQRNLFSTDGGKATDAFVIDAAAKWEFFKRKQQVLNLGFEAVTVQGLTTQARSDTAAISKVRQFGAAFKSSYRLGGTTLYFDLGYASGDQNPGDDRIENFRFDRDYKVGLILFDQVLSYQSARSSVRASDPALVGVAPEGADLLGTGGGVTGAAYVFPRVKFNLRKWVDLYGGPLFAFGTAKLTDPYNTRLGGGTSRNALGGSPGNYLGTEVDIGLQVRCQPIPAITITSTLEAGYFAPGDAFNNAAGNAMTSVYFGRVRLGVKL